MRIPFCPFIDLLSTDIPVIVDLSVEWEDGTAHILVNNIYENGGKVSILFNNDPRFHGIGDLISDMAEKDGRLLDEAKAQDNDERRAA
jgi:hypothetical protein